MIDRIRQLLGKDEPKVAPAAGAVVLTGPPGVHNRVAAARRTMDVFQDLFRQAREVVKVFSPYVDPNFTAMASTTTVPIRIVTTVREGRVKSSPVLERCSSERAVSVRYMHEKRGGSQLFQLHAKMILCDRRAAYVGSANFTDTSLRYNLELGTYVEDRAVIDDLHRLFDHVFDFLAQPARA